MTIGYKRVILVDRANAQSKMPVAFAYWLRQQSILFEGLRLIRVESIDEDEC